MDSRQIYIKSITVCNIQSYENETKIVLANDRINRLAGPSNAGKTVMFKIPYKMVFFKSVYYRENHNTLLRDGCSAGYCYYELSDNTIIKFFMEDKTQHFAFVDENGIEETIWEEEMPDKLIKKMGLIVDKAQKIILNITGDSKEKPFLTTSPTWNMRALKNIISDSDSDTAKTVLKADYDMLTKMISGVETIIKSTSITSSYIPYIDMNNFNSIEYIVDKLDTYYENVTSITNEIIALRELIKNANKLGDKSIELDNLNKIETYHFTLKDIINKLNVLHSKLYMKESEDITIKSDDLQKLHAYYITLMEVISILNKMVTCARQFVAANNKIGTVYQKQDSLDKISIYINKISIILTELETLKSLLGKSEEFSNLELELNTLQSVEYLGKYLNTMINVYNTIREVKDLYCKFATANKQYTEVKKEETELKSKIKVCPLCNKPFEEG